MPELRPGVPALLLLHGNMAARGMRRRQLLRERTPGLARLAGAVVVYMHMGDARQAWATYQDYLEVEAFSNSPEAFAAENLMQAYASGKADYVRQAVRQGRSWNALDGQVRAGIERGGVSRDGHGSAVLHINIRGTLSHNFMH